MAIGLVLRHATKFGENDFPTFSLFEVIETMVIRVTEVTGQL